MTNPTTPDLFNTGQTAVRSQGEDAVTRQLFSNDAPENVDSSNDRPITRQEFKDEANVNLILQRFGLTGPQRTPVYGERDMQVELQTVYKLQEDAKAFHAKLPPELTERYPTVGLMLEGMAEGNLFAELEALAQQRDAGDTTQPPSTGDTNGTPNPSP